MKKLFVNKIILTFMLGSFLISSCTTNEIDWDKLTSEIKIDQSLVLPIGETTFSIEDLLNSVDTINNFIGADESLLYFYLTDSMEIGKFIKKAKVISESAPSEVFVDLSPMMLFSPFPPNTQLPTVNVPAEMYLGFNEDPNSQIITKVIANSAKISIEINETDLDIPASNIKITMKFNPANILLDSGEESVSYTPSAYNVAEDIELPAFTMDVASNVNSLPFSFEVSAKTSNNAVVILPTSSITLKYKFNGIDYKVAYGSFSPSTSLYTQTKIIDLDLESLVPSGLKVKLAEPQIDFSVKSDLGIKLGFDINYFKAYSVGKTDTITALFNGVPTTRFAINAAPSLGLSSLTENLLLNHEDNNGQIDRLFDGELPNKIKYSYKVENVDDGVLDFITPSPKLKIYYHVKAPLKLKAGSYLELKDTIPELEFDSLLKQDYIDNVKLVMQITNGIPFGADLKLRLLKADGTAIANTTIVTEYKINAPVVDDNGLVRKSELSTQTLIISVNKSQLNDLRATKSIEYNFKLENKIGEIERPVYLEKTNSFKVKIGILVKADATIETK